MNNYSEQLRHRFLMAMGLGSLTISLLSACETDEKPPEEDTDVDTDTETEEEPDPLDVDDDGDGFTENQGDCDDTDSALNPADNDLDGYSTCTGDCDDTDPTIFTDAEEIINDGIDQNCDGEDLIDVDLDGHSSEVDCNDEDDTIFPGAEEVCDGIDNDCDTEIDNNAQDALSWYADSDLDTFGDANAVLMACEQPEGYVTNSDDCDDTDASIYPNADEVPEDGLDNNCDGDIDEIECPAASLPADAYTIESNYWAGNYIPYMFCDSLPASGVCPSISQIDAYQMVIANVGNPTDTWCSWYVVPPLCGPTGDVAAECCYVFGVEPMCLAVGRPLTVDGKVRTASIVNSSAWTREVHLDCSDLNATQKETLLDEWLKAAREEHASVASFARFALELLSLGAPPELLAGATRAQADEIAHARSCFGIASEIAGTDFGPGTLDITGALPSSISAEQVLINTIMEGCINESLAAAEAAWLQDKSAVTSIQKVLSQIANDEARHAALAWKTVRWLVTTRPELTDIARETFARAGQLLDQMDKETADDSWLIHYGRMPAKEGNHLRRDVWHKVIVPCAEALLLPAKATAVESESYLS